MFAVEAMQMLDVLHSFVFVANLCSIFFVESCIQLVGGKNTSNKAHTDLKKPFANSVTIASPIMSGRSILLLRELKASQTGLGKW